MKHIKLFEAVNFNKYDFKGYYVTNGVTGEDIENIIHSERKELTENDLEIMSETLGGHYHYDDEHCLYFPVDNGTYQLYSFGDYCYAIAYNYRDFVSLDVYDGIDELIDGLEEVIMNYVGEYQDSDDDVDDDDDDDVLKKD